MELAELEKEDAAEFMEAMGIHELSAVPIIQAAYRVLDRISFLTAGADEVRAWTIRQGSNAVTAAGAIHSDLARGFIRAELVAFEDFEAAGGCWDEARAAGKMRLEGKEYIVKDGDILHVRHKT